MILLYDSEGKIRQIQVGQCLNIETVETDGYMVCEEGGKRDLPDGLLPFNLDELSLPLEAEAVEAAVYAETDQYQIKSVDGSPALVEVTR